MVSSLMIFMLFAGLGLGIGLWLWHMRKPEKRHPTKDQPHRSIEQIITETPQDMRRS